MHDTTLSFPSARCKSALRILLTVLACSASWALAAIPVYGYVVKASYPHDPQAFTQGLVFKDGVLYEGTGLNGHSSIRKVQLETGKVLQKQDIDRDHFGEGIAVVGNDIIALTWTSHLGFVFDLKTFKLKHTFNYPGEGWGLAQNGQFVFMSDGTAAIRVLHPTTLAEVRRIDVTADGAPVERLNELEWVEGEIFANVWGTDTIARIDPTSGHVTGWIDLSGLLEQKWKGIRNSDVLNGIAYDAKAHRLFVTGKLWPRLFEIELVRK
jgi:glutamine cyclotransferase